MVRICLSKGAGLAVKQLLLSCVFSDGEGGGSCFECVEFNQNQTVLVLAYDVMKSYFVYSSRNLKDTEKH